MNINLKYGNGYNYIIRGKIIMLKQANATLRGPFLLQLIKIAIGSAVSIFIADLIGLNYSTSAGIITLLTIQDTSKETISISIKRIYAFLLATFISYAAFHIFDYNAFSYGIFLFIFIAFCKPLHLSNAASTNAVLVTHYFLQKDMSFSLICNEALLLFIGAGIGTLLNLYMPGKAKEIRAVQHTLEEDLKTVLLRMSEYIKKEDKSDYTGTCFDKLSEDISKGKKQAYAYMNNTFFQESKYFIEYMNMREQQCIVLKDIYNKIINIRTVLPQSNQISSFIYEIGISFGETNNAKALLKKLSDLFEQMKNSPLPATREEFEERAILYSILMDFEYFLQLKKGFSDSLTKEQIEKYWYE